MVDIGYVEISQERFDELLETELWVEALDSAGVDNWSGYDEAREIYREMKE